MFPDHRIGQQISKFAVAPLSIDRFSPIEFSVVTPLRPHNSLLAFAARPTLMTEVAGEHLRKRFDENRISWVIVLGKV